MCRFHQTTIMNLKSHTIERWKKFSMCKRNGSKNSSAQVIKLYFSQNFITWKRILSHARPRYGQVDMYSVLFSIPHFLIKTKIRLMFAFPLSCSSYWCQRLPRRKCEILSCGLYYSFDFHPRKV